ncbi:MAG: extracellular solute-binding protein [Butyrivibrio sp.]|nr:extracellular solute-binding protein [Butyrivibrio sp.]MBQ8031352.1 extracellular solute-binding protein [Butyrivibrio sp.]MBR1641133.1 extracellular solute-binding protein [Butyrivibrio sp.]
MKKKVLSLVLASSMIMSMLAGCGSSADTQPAATGENKTEAVDAAIENATAKVEESGFSYTGEGPISEDGGTIKILAQTSNYSNVDITKAPIVLKVFEEAGVDPEWQLLDYNSYEEAITPMLSAGNIDADIVKIPDNDPNQIWIKSGMFVPLDEYFEYMPNFTKWLNENPVQKAELTAEDGHIYYVAGVNVAHDYQPTLMFNQVWLDKAGKTAPETLDELVELLRYYKENDMNDNGDASDEIPMSIMSEFLPYMFGPAFGLDLVSGFQADDSGKVTYAAADSENYRKYLEFLNGLYSEGLLEVEFTSLDRDKVIERISNDLTGVAFDYSWAMSMMYSNVLPYYDGTAATAFVGVKPLSGDHEGFYVGRNFLSGMFGVSSKSSQIELACKFLDYSMSEHCQDYYQWGIEGESYVVNSDGSREYTEQGKDNDWLQQFGINPAFVFPAQQSVEATDILVADWHAKINADMRQYVVDPWPMIYATSEESDTINMYLEDIQTNVDENATAFITGTKDLATEFDGYISGLEALNLPELVSIRQQQYDRYLKALNN